MTDLLNPRFELISDYPDNTNKVGSILSCPDFDKDFTKECWVKSYEKYPNIFRKLNWWEKREESEMPMYLKDSELMAKSNNDKTGYYKIEKWDMELMLGIIEKGRKGVCSILTWKPEYTYQPATEEEYLNSLK